MSAIRLGDKAPNFIAQSIEGEINFHEWLGDGWGVLFSHPADYTPVCTTELGTVAKYKPAFEARLLLMVPLPYLLQAAPITSLGLTKLV